MSYLSGLFSFFLPGLGQFYNREYRKGLLVLFLMFAWVFLFAYSFGLLFFIPLFWSLYFTFDAIQVAERKQTTGAWRFLIWLVVMLLVYVGFWVAFDTVISSRFHDLH